MYLQCFSFRACSVVLWEVPESYAMDPSASQQIRLNCVRELKENNIQGSVKAVMYPVERDGYWMTALSQANDIAAVVTFSSPDSKL